MTDATVAPPDLDHTHDNGVDISPEVLIPVDSSNAPAVKDQSEYLHNEHFVSILSNFLINDKINKDSLNDSSPDDYVEYVGDAIPKSNNNQESIKKRPRDDRENPESKLCVATAKGDTCQYGDNCRFSHDISKYLQNKPSDIAPNCYVFDQFGYCNFGLMCRFGNSHIVNSKNIARSEELGGVKPRQTINSLSKELQNILRKKNSPYSHSTGKFNGQNKHKNKPISDVDPSANPTIELEFNSTPYDTPVKLVDFSNKVYVAPLTTVGNLPFRRIMKELGADITCGEMALGFNLQQGQSSEWALLRKHESENTFGIQVAGAQPNQMSLLSKLLEEHTVSDFIDLNCGCPIDLVCDRGCGAALMNRPKRLCEVVTALSQHLNRSVTVKIRTGWDTKAPTAHKLIPELQKANVDRKLAAIMLHGRSRLQRYHKLADWDYILQAARSQDLNYPVLPIIGNGDIMSFEDWESHKHMLQSQLQSDESVGELGLCGCAMLGRGALIKPWLPSEIKESRHWDISATERLDMLKRFVNYGLEHWGSDFQGVNTTRRFLLEWLSFLHRYVPVGLLDSTVQRAQRINQRTPLYFGRDDLETLLSSNDSQDWLRIAVMLLGPLPENFQFEPKHKSSSYA